MLKFWEKYEKSVKTKEYNKKYDIISLGKVNGGYAHAKNINYRR